MNVFDLPNVFCYDLLFDALSCEIYLHILKNIIHDANIFARTYNWSGNFGISLIDVGIYS